MDPGPPEKGLPSLRVLYDYAWFVGFGVAFVLYSVLMRGTPVVDLDRSLVPTFFASVDDIGELLKLS